MIGKFTGIFLLLVVFPIVAGLAVWSDFYYDPDRYDYSRTIWNTEIKTLEVNEFTNETGDFDKNGATPYLDAIDYPTNWIEGKSGYTWWDKYYYFENITNYDLSNPRTNNIQIIEVNLTITFKGQQNGQGFNPYINDDYYGDAVVVEGVWLNQTWDVTVSVTDINATKFSLYSSSSHEYTIIDYSWLTTTINVEYYDHYYPVREMLDGMISGISSVMWLIGIAILFGAIFSIMGDR